MQRQKTFIYLEWGLLVVVNALMMVINPVVCAHTHSVRVQRSTAAALAALERKSTNPCFPFLNHFRRAFCHFTFFKARVLSE